MTNATFLLIYNSNHAGSYDSAYSPAQSIAVKSNVLYDLTGTLNLGGEIRCDDTHSFNLSVNYNPGIWEKTKK
mgnify:CR=1 FL=1